MEQSLSIPFSIDSSSVGTVVIKQKSWDDSDIVTKEDVLIYFMNRFYDYNLDEKECQSILHDSGIDFFRTEIYVYPIPKETEYTLHVSEPFDTLPSELGERVITTLENTETVSIDMRKEVDTEFPVQELLDVYWLLPVFDEEGRDTTPPSLRIEDNNVVIGRMVYGAVVVTYTYEQHTYDLKVYSRPDVIEENKYDSIVYAKVGTSFVTHEVEPPDMSSTDCANSGVHGTGIVTSDPDDPTSSGADHHDEYDYCTRQKKGEEE